MQSQQPTGLLTEKALIRELLERSRKLGSGFFWTNAFWILCRKKKVPSDLLEEYLVW